MMLDEAILEELKLNGAGTVRDIRDRLSHGVYAALKTSDRGREGQRIRRSGEGKPQDLRPAKVDGLTFILGNCWLDALRTGSGGL
jgi:hypothetical protein